MTRHRWRFTGVGATPGRIALAVGLAAAFLYTLATTLNPQGDAVPTLNTRRASGQRPSVLRAASLADKLPADQQRNISIQSAPAEKGEPLGRASEVQPIISLADALKHNPFQLPKTLLTVQPKEPEPASTPSTKPRLSLPNDPVAMVVVGAKSSVAVWGNREVAVGDVVDGYRVVSVSHEGIVVEPVD